MTTELQRKIARIEKVLANWKRKGKPTKRGFLKSLNEQGITFADAEDVVQLDLRTGKRFSNE